MTKSRCFTLTDIARAMRTLEKSEYGWRIRILPDGSILIEKEGSAGDVNKEPSSKKPVVRL